MGGKHSRTKGHSAERWLAKLLRDLGIFPEARRQLEYHVDDCRGIDLQYTDNLAFQVKRYKDHVPINKIYEIKDTTKEPVLVSRPDRKEAMVVIRLEYFLVLLKFFRSNNGNGSRENDMERAIRSN